MGLILLMNWASSHPVGTEKAQQLAETFWQQSGCAIRSGISANALTDITAQTEFSHLYIFSTDGGFAILSADDCAQPILAYSTCDGLSSSSKTARSMAFSLTYSATSSSLPLPK